MDLDSWNVSVSPDGLTEFWNPMLSLQLACKKAEKHFKDHPVFKKWILVATCGANLRIPPEFKTKLFEALKLQGKVILVNDNDTAFIEGHHTVTVRSFIRALKNIKCQTVRVTSYGMKEPLDEDEDLDLGDPSHPMAMYNFFDLGVKHQSDDLLLVKPKNKTKGLTSYQILVPINEGFGTASFVVKVGDKTYKVKVYSPVIHCIKAMCPPVTLLTFNDIGTCIRRLAMAKTYLAKLRIMDASFFTGLRIEVSVTAPSISAAVAQVNTTELLTPESYLTSTSEAMQPYLMEVKRVPRETYLNNFEAMINKAEATGLFYGRTKTPASLRLQQVVRDMINSMGKFTGFSRASSIANPDAWWNGNARLPLPGPAQANPLLADAAQADPPLADPAQANPPLGNPAPGGSMGPGPPQEVRDFFAAEREQRPEVLAFLKGPAAIHAFWQARRDAIPCYHCHAWPGPYSQQANSTVALRLKSIKFHWRNKVLG